MSIKKNDIIIKKNNFSFKKKETIKVYERIRDIHVIENFILLFFETTGTIAIYERN